MRALAYLRRAHHELARQPAPAASVSPATFRGGALWMHQQLRRLRPAGLLPPFEAGKRFGWYGGLKYGLCLLAAALLAAPLLLTGRWAWLPLAGLAFYLVEIHLLFVFPLLLDGHPQPLRHSARLLHQRVGVGPALLTVLPIAAHMLLGLLRPRRPLLHWYAGCLAVLYWYEDVRETLPNARPGSCQEFRIVSKKSW